MKNKNTAIVGFLSIIAAIVTVPAFIGYAAPVAPPPNLNTNANYTTITAGNGADIPDTAASFKAGNYAVWGLATDAGGSGGLFKGDFGVIGESGSADGYGVKGTSRNATGFGVMGTNTNPAGAAASFSNSDGSQVVKLGTPDLGINASYSGYMGAAGQFTGTNLAGEQYSSVLGSNGYDDSVVPASFTSKDEFGSSVSNIELASNFSGDALYTSGMIKNAGLQIDADGVISTGGVDFNPVKIVDPDGLRLEGILGGFEAVVTGTATAGFFATSGNTGISASAGGTTSTGGSFTGTFTGVYGNASAGRTGVSGTGTTSGVSGTTSSATKYGVVGLNNQATGTAASFTNYDGSADVKLGTPTIGVVGTYTGARGSGGKFIGDDESGSYSAVTAVLGDTLTSGHFYAFDSAGDNVGVRLANGTNAVDATGSIVQNNGLSIAANGDISYPGLPGLPSAGINYPVNIADTDGMTSTGKIAATDGTYEAALMADGSIKAGKNLGVNGYIWSSTENVMINDNLLIPWPAYSAQNYIWSGGGGVPINDANGVTIVANGVVNNVAFPATMGDPGPASNGKIVKLTGGTDSSSPGCTGSPYCPPGKYIWHGNVWHALQGAYTGLVVNNSNTNGEITVNANNGFNSGVTINGQAPGNTSAATLNTGAGALTVHSTSTSNNGLRFDNDYNGNNPDVLVDPKTAFMNAQTGAGYFAGRVTSDTGIGTYTLRPDATGIAAPIAGTAVISKQVVPCPPGEIVVSCGRKTIGTKVKTFYIFAGDSTWNGVWPVSPLPPLPSVVNATTCYFGFNNNGPPTTIYMFAQCYDPRV